MINHIEQLRQFMKSADWPLNLQEWPVEINMDTNCLAFALGLPYADVNRDTFRFPKNSNLEEELQKWFSSLGLEYRKINSIDEAKNDEIIIQCFEYILALYGKRDYHLIRRNLDGTWVHKQGWEEAPCQITDWSDFSFWYHPEETLLCTYVIKRM